MAVKKATSRTRSTTKRSRSTTSPAKRAVKPRKTATSAPEAPERAVQEPATAEQPSQFTGDHYLHAIGPEPAEGSARRPGKWLIFVSRSRVDAMWNDVRRAVERGRLGYAAKVSTALPNPLSPDPKKHLICVFTVDQEDAADVRRVRAVLRELGVSWKIPYKSDLAGAGGHEWTGGPAAKYYE